MNVQTIVSELKTHQQDFDWYPTTSEIIRAVAARMEIHGSGDVLDVGAGDGRVLKELPGARKLAIEKSTVLIREMDSDIYVIGTNFWEQTLIDKNVKYLFTNPPYSEFKPWAIKTIKEAQAEYLYLVLPTRWADDVSIKNALMARKADWKVILSTNFLSGDRAARVEVDVVEVNLAEHYAFMRKNEMHVDPFSLWFDEYFPLNENKTTFDSEDSAYDGYELTPGTDLVSTLDACYQRDFERLGNAYKVITSVDATILKELSIDKKQLCEGFKFKAQGLKSRYWKQLFDNFGKVNSRLTAASRESMFNTLNKNINVDFTKANAHAVLEWVIKNANCYFDQQLIDTYQEMVEMANTRLYKSNVRTFSNDDWRYWNVVNGKSSLSHYQLDYRIVLTRKGGYQVSQWSFENDRPSGEMVSFLNDLIVLAGNLGYDTSSTPRAGERSWNAGKPQHFKYYNHTKETVETLFEAKLFKNGNSHVRFNPHFIMRLNVEFGRLKGWLRSKEDVVREMDIPAEVPVDEAMAFFGTNHQLTADSLNFLRVELKAA